MQSPDTKFLAPETQDSDSLDKKGIFKFKLTENQYLQKLFISFDACNQNPNNVISDITYYLNGTPFPIVRNKSGLDTRVNPFSKVIGKESAYELELPFKNFRPSCFEVEFVKNNPGEPMHNFKVFLQVSSRSVEVLTYEQEVFENVTTGKHFKLNTITKPTQIWSNSPDCKLVIDDPEFSSWRRGDSIDLHFEVDGVRQSKRRIYY